MTSVLSSIRTQRPPFSVRSLNIDSDGATRVATAASIRPVETVSLLPATYRTKNDHIANPKLNILDFLERDLRVNRINAVQEHLWICGRPMPPRPLHYQILLGRNILLHEQIELHLVWSKKGITIKPLPRYLLDPDFWEEHILSNRTSLTENDVKPNTPEYEKQNVERLNTLAACARGFLFSYTALISHESDFRIARENGLLPDNLTWAGWKALSEQLAHSHSYESINPRYWYGELRLGRLNFIYRWRLGYLLRGFTSAHNSYGDFFADNLTLLTATLGYVVIMLTAMQVGLATDRLVVSPAFQSASYGFTVFSMLSPLIVIFALIVVMLMKFVSNWAATKSYEQKRFQKMDVVPYWRNYGHRPESSTQEGGIA